MSNNLSSIGALAYQGTNAQMPPNVFIFNDLAPAITDWRNFSLGDLWINRVQQSINDSEIYVLLGIAKSSNPATPNNRANWVLLSNSNGNVNHVTTDAGTVIPVAGNINLFGGHDINTSGTGATATVALNNSITLGDVAPIGAGVNALSALTGDINIGAGNLKLPAYDSVGSQGIIKIGGSRFITTDGVDNQFFGLNAGNLTLTGHNNTVIGGNGLNLATTSSENLLVGNNIMTTVTSGGTGNLIVGNAAYNIGTDVHNVIVGNNSFLLATTAANNSSLGNSCAYDSGSSLGLTTGDNNVIIGNNSGSAFRGNESNNITISSLGVVADSGVIRIGTPGTQNTNFQAGISGVSVSSLSSSLPVQINSSGQLGASGNIYLPLTNTGGTQGVINADIFSFIHNGPPSSGSTFCGINAGDFASTGGRNSGFGYQSLDLIGSGLDNTGCGQESLGTLAGGSTNSALGSQSGEFLVSGSGNLLLGFQAGINYTGAESNNILLAHTGVLAENNVIRLGTAGTQLKNFQAGIVGVTTDAADAIPVLISSTGQLGTVSSSMRYKTNIRDLNGQSESIYKLRPVSFNYISHPDNEAWGLIAEEVEEVMPQLVVYNKDQQPETVRYNEINILLLNELQKLAKKNDDMLKRIEVLEAQLLKE